MRKSFFIMEDRGSLNLSGEISSTTIGKLPPRSERAWKFVMLKSFGISHQGWPNMKRMRTFTRSVLPALLFP